MANDLKNIDDIKNYCDNLENFLKQIDISDSFEFFEYVDQVLLDSNISKAANEKNRECYINVVQELKQEEEELTDSIINSINNLDNLNDNKNHLKEFFFEEYGINLDEFINLENSDDKYYEALKQAELIQEKQEKEFLEEYIAENYGEDVLAKLNDENLNQISNDELQRLQEQIEKENQEKLERQEKFFNIALNVMVAATVYNVAKDLINEKLNEKLNENEYEEPIK